ncbi:MAG: hypothetical protein HYV07_25595 [Deltaproteobacteria bacterium]|nr:hypothetical protein [Deltaproteobacteria bacterium]
MIFGACPGVAAVPNPRVRMAAVAALLASCGSVSPTPNPAVREDAGLSEDAARFPVDAAHCQARGADGCPVTQPPSGFATQCETACEQFEVGKACDYGSTTCRCTLGSGVRWECNDARCPAKDDFSASCSDPGLSCSYFERGCVCVTPENRWACCGGVWQCPPPFALQEGGLCCDKGEADPPCYQDTDGGSRQCYCQANRWSCN